MRRGGGAVVGVKAHAGRGREGAEEAVEEAGHCGGHEDGEEGEDEVGGGGGELQFGECGKLGGKGGIMGWID